MQTKYLKYIVAVVFLAGAGYTLWPVASRVKPAPQQRPAPQQSAAPAPAQPSSGQPSPGGQPSSLLHALAKANVQPIEPVAVPDFSLPDVARRKVRFSDFAGKVVMVNFWTTYWPYCARERAALEKLYQKYKGRGFTVLAISMDQDTSLVGPYVKSYKLTFPNLMDPDGSVYPIFGVRYTPTNYLINRKGEVVGRTIGYRDWDTPQAYAILERLLAEKAPPEKTKKIARN